ncbi:MAG: type II secretion system F family protein [Chloroflexota bacterium]
MMTILIIGGAIIVVVVIIGIVVTARSEHSLVEERLGRYLDEEAETAARPSGERVSPIGDWLNSMLEGSKAGEGVSKELARADLKIRPAEYYATCVIVGVGTAVVAWVLNGRGPLNNPYTIGFMALGFVVGLFLPRLWVKRLQGQRLVRFNDQLADMLNLMVNGLRAGYSTVQAMEAVSKEMPTPISDEFRRVVQEMQLGLTMEVALDNLLRRIPSEDLDLVVTAINVQREVGGNLAEILDTISYTVRERVRIKGEIRVLTSQVIYSGRFLALMPVIISLVLWVVNKPYMMEFFKEYPAIPCCIPPGVIVLIIAGMMIAAGYFIMTRIANVEV